MGKPNLFANGLKLFRVEHYAFQTDDLKPAYTLVAATSRKEALGKFNKVAKKREAYPYCWNEADLEDVSLVDEVKDIIR